MLPTTFIYPEVLSYKSELVEIRRHLHENPELSFQAFKTSAFVASFLEKLGLEVFKDVGKTGVVGFLKGSFPGWMPCHCKKQLISLLKARIQGYIMLVDMMVMWQSFSFCLSIYSESERSWKSWLLCCQGSNIYNYANFG